MFVPPLNVTVAPEKVIDEVFAFNVRFVEVAQFQTVVLAPVIVIALAPSVSVLVFELVEENIPHEHV